jgi:hypothetical protein
MGSNMVPSTVSVSKCLHALMCKSRIQWSCHVLYTVGYLLIVLTYHFFFLLSCCCCCIMSAVECKQQQLFYYQTGYGNMCLSLMDPYHWWIHSSYCLFYCVPMMQVLFLLTKQYETTARTFTVFEITAHFLQPPSLMYRLHWGKWQHY